jgi:hypothetical protein
MPEKSSQGDFPATSTDKCEDLSFFQRDIDGAEYLIAEKFLADVSHLQLGSIILIHLFYPSKLGCDSYLSADNSYDHVQIVVSLSGIKGESTTLPLMIATRKPYLMEKYFSGTTRSALPM